MAKIYKTLDLTGTSCAGPIGELLGVMDEIKEGEAVEAIVGDAETAKQVREWVKATGFKMIDDREKEGKYWFVIGR
ncbi:sulfurtransferase TusA family protein [Sulfuracidifex metallicus]|jgi:TusA-related sulfurtransferase|uniref:sulfurtransferase TusA family protein n=1 Tax=Sulfuracidifex metallicus TaxID=47303 RepID=UPI002277077C|nr:sulfurtransferase TusA family protein [Sulfuracidifex metallicus]MCY0849450.1 sulfurtransferase TusA family protein [Sulfuracidifex metallicus]